MMESASWKKGVLAALKTAGFSKQGKVMIFAGADVVVLCGLDYHWRRWFVDVGFWVRALQPYVVTERVEHTHLYYRLEGLFPELLDTITMAGALDEPRCESEYAHLLEAIRDPIGPRLLRLGSLEELREAYRRGLLNDGLIRREVRPILENDVRGPGGMAHA